jgi:HK97 family phage major capsid protein
VKSKLKELQGKAAERRGQLHEIFEQAGEDMDMSKVTVLEGDSEAKVGRIRELNKELDEIGAEIEPLEAEAAELNRAKRHADEFAEGRKGHPLPRRQEQDPAARVDEPTQTLGEVIMGAGIAERRDQAIEVPDADAYGALFETGTGWQPETIRTGRLVEKAVRPIQVIDVIPGGSTSQNAVVYMEETVFNNTAAETAEAGQYPEAALGLEEKSSPVRKIAVFLPVTDEQLEDVPQAQGYINNRLPFMIRQRLDGQITAGDGIAPNLLGILHREGIQARERGTDPTPDAIYKALTRTRVVGRAIPGPVLMQPFDWEDIRLMRTADGIYIWGSPSEAGPERIWGQPVVQADTLPEGTALTGDFANFSELAIRRGLELKLSDSHSDFFIKGKQAIRCDMRAALVIYRPAAFVEITGI